MSWIFDISAAVYKYLEVSLLSFLIGQTKQITFQNKSIRNFFLFHRGTAFLFFLHGLYHTQIGKHCQTLSCLEERHDFKPWLTSLQHCRQGCHQKWGNLALLHCMKVADRRGIRPASRTQTCRSPWHHRCLLIQLPCQEDTS